MSVATIPEKLITCSETYASATGFACNIIDGSGEIVYSTNKSVSPFCHKVSSSCSNKISCQRAHQYGIHQSLRFAGKYVYFCPLGLIHWTSAYVDEHNNIFAILCGPIHMVDPDEFMLKDFWARFGFDESTHMQLSDEVNSIPVVETGKVDSLTELLVSSVIYYGGRDLRAVLDSKQSLEHQAEIWDYISSLKYLWKEGSLPAYPLEKEKELLLLISSGDEPGARRVLNEIMGSIFFSTGDFEVIKSRVLELTVLLSRAALETGADPSSIFGLNHTFLDELQRINTVDELTFWLTKIMQRFSQNIFTLADVKHSDILFKAINYVKDNYMKKITLDEVASYVHLSPTYFSRIFKQDMNENFIVWLNAYRIEKSKNYLMNRLIPLVEIAGLVGFEDQSYFSKVFKKHTSVTPGKFRESRGRSTPPLIK